MGVKVLKSKAAKIGRAFSFAENAPQDRSPASPVYSTKLGSMYCGDSYELLKSARFKKYNGSVQLAFTSPPFPLNTKKSYGNKKGDEYIEWLASLAPLLLRVLKPEGSIVIEIGNAWESSQPVMSTVVLRALLKFLERGGLHLCQEFVWYNPARLPSPVQWVNIERIRVKDAFTRVWWMSPVVRPKADNRRILKAYSASMRSLIRRGKYNSGLRPSQHNIGPSSFNSDNGGAIPPNVIDGDKAHFLSNFLKSTNTRSSEQYQLICRENNIPLHPARMPSELAQFFIKFLTDERDLVLDPFGGSNTTGEAAESLGRRWISIEANWAYASSSISRFPFTAVKRKSKGIKVRRSSLVIAAE